MTDATSQIEGLLKDYFDGLYDCDVKKLARVFHPRAIYATADEETPLVRSMDEYFEVISERISPASRIEKRCDFVDHIEVAGENTARAKVRCSIGNRDFVDFLSCVRVDGSWQIIAKVFQITERKEE